MIRYVLCFFLCCNLSANREDDILARESIKKIEKINFNTVDDKAQKAKDAFFADEYFEEESPEEHEYVIDFDFPPMTQEQILADEKRAESFAKELAAREKKHRKAVFKFVKENPQQKGLIENLIQQYVVDNKEKKEIYWVDIAYLVGNFYKKRNATAHAIYFYKIATDTDEYPEYVYFNMHGAMVAYINKYITENKPKYPTAELFYALKESIDYADTAHNYSSDELSLALYRKEELRNILNSYIRFPLSPKKVLNNKYYGEKKLYEMIYSNKFIDYLLKNLPPIAGLLVKNNINALSSCLKKRGFKQIIRQGKSDDQYIFINPKGLQIRIKNNRKDYSCQLTVGVCFKISLGLVDKELRALFQKTSKDENSKFEQNFKENKFLVDFIDNEILKIIFLSDKGFMLLPARHNKYSPYWGLGRYDENVLMNEAHKKITTSNDALKKLKKNSRWIDNIGRLRICQ